MPDVADTMNFSDDSRLCAAAQPNALLSSSRDSGWHSVLVDVMEGSGRSDSFETHPTTDLTLVVCLRGRHQLDVLGATAITRSMPFGLPRSAYSTMPITAAKTAARPSAP